ncbi:hypothetical protein Fmac_017695 [Flemingia macrophylla]|uniref:Myb/SANT-like DNA-binding domain-containing protein n=1 Tax=Flemingia macrophylla TaxID=520843 RepID=A0ABD1M2V7_9FABA
MASPTDSNPPPPSPSPSPSPRLPPPAASLPPAGPRRRPPPSSTPTAKNATHWQEVADAVTAHCPSASPTAKTAVQCRHKMEKLRKRYRTELQRLRNLPLPRFNASPSSWVHFKSMDSMEKGPSKPNANNLVFLDLDDDDANHHHHHHNNNNNSHDNNDDDDLYEEFKNAAGSNTRSLNKLYRNGPVPGPGFRIRIPAASGGATSKPLNNSASANGSRGAKREREREDAVAEMAGAIRVLREGFVRMEQMKMEMAREIETMRMEMEMKRTEMILDSQQRIVEAFARAVSHKRPKPRPNSTPSPHH